MIYLKNGHSITIGNAGALASRTHVSYADVSGATLDGSSATRFSGNAAFNEANAVASSDVSASGLRYLAKAPVYSGIRSISPDFSAGTYVSREAMFSFRVT